MSQGGVWLPLPSIAAFLLSFLSPFSRTETPSSVKNVFLLCFKKFFLSNFSWFLSSSFDTQIKNSQPITTISFGFTGLKEEEEVFKTDLRDF